MEQKNLQLAHLIPQYSSSKSSLLVMLPNNSFDGTCKICTTLLLRGTEGAVGLRCFGENIQMCSRPPDSQKFHSGINCLSFFIKFMCSPCARKKYGSAAKIPATRAYHASSV